MHLTESLYHLYCCFSVFLYHPRLPPLGATPWTPRMCCPMPCVEVKLAAHSEHGNGFSPVCCLSCPLRAWEFSCECTQYGF